jgi:acyl-[acyl-carrier-protein]-phospholipid O-acyltransferase/long-chain-fatty-acid--[acyl-carrier-protein] ligase
MNRVPVNLNYTTSPANLESAARQCEMTHVITARAFLERLPIAVPGKPVYLEDIMKTVTKKDRIVALLLAIFCPVRLLEKMLGLPGKRSQTDLATIVFSSGSEGNPKGVMLTHYNILSDIECLAQVFPHKTGDVMIGFLPFFHSFGFMGTLWTPITNGLAGAFHPSPLETKAIGELIFKYKARFLIGTPTFLQAFIRRCAAEELSSLSFVVCGAEKLTTRLRDAFREKFNKEPYDGYGTTECGPVVSLNVPDVPLSDLYQRGSKRGSVGRPLPSISVRVVDPDTGEVLQEDQPGILQIRGPNIMQGYLNMPEKTAEVLKDGWYASGDIATVDENGFITITDRFARFSKIAGEMVSHQKVEESLHALLGLTEQSLAVAGVPDRMRGERLVVLHTLSEEQLQQLIDKLDECDLPNLARPRTDNFYKIEAIPVLGTGKMDIKSVKAMAATLDMGE